MAAWRAAVKLVGCQASEPWQAEHSPCLAVEPWCGSAWQWLQAAPWPCGAVAAAARRPGVGSPAREASAAGTSLGASGTGSGGGGALALGATSLGASGTGIAITSLAASQARVPRGKCASAFFGGAPSFG